VDATADTLQKALRINLDPRWYGTIAEIGAGQEVARWFFRAGGAAGTVAKSISAYDMAVSDAVYGKSGRYVSMPRLQAMLDLEFHLNLERLDAERGDSNAFFAFADTVTARSFVGGNECHIPTMRPARSSCMSACWTSKQRSSRKRSALSALTCCTPPSSSTTSRRCSSKACSTG
jgi:hypothetical protein